MAEQVSSPWPDLPPELLGLVLSRMPSQADRPLLPWLALHEGAFLSFPDGELYRLPVLLADDDDVSHRVSAGADIIFCGGLGSCCCLQSLAPHRTPHLACGPPQTCTPPVELELYADDIEFFQGMLYVVSTKYVLSPTYAFIHHHRELHVLEPTGDPPSPVLCIPGTTTGACSTGRYKHYYYLVVSGDRLLMVEREIEFHLLSRKHIWTRQLEVLEATDLHNGVGNGRWTKVDNFRGHALFVSQDCSRSLPVANQYQDCPDDDFLESCVYNIREQTLTPLPIEMKTAMVSHAGPWSLSWVFLP
ncbi:hypothetical protein BRADI_4g25444v3 [Brachypodium distachyon]|uniref:KIB1-4 beta-propeller domain-containing protein n=1 Tax=Brachypodium distachyon TaxID=15368 RepID=A0A0Q3PJ35_BRADI|nr:hypothetical protein BRADI_4g25444v3 [Brachypodium distachyon]